MLQLMQEAGGFPAASLLSHGSAQGSSNLIYILKSLQVHGSPETTAPWMPAYETPTGLACSDAYRMRQTRKGVHC